MPIMLKSTGSLKDYTPDDLKTVAVHINRFRTIIADRSPKDNILNQGELEFTDQEIVDLLQQAMDDINSDIPLTNYTLVTFDEEDLLPMGGVVFACIQRGFMHLKNNLSLSDGGLNVNMFDKTGPYQQWASFLYQDYTQGKATYKRTVVPNSSNSGFYGVGSEWGYMGW